MSDYANMFQQYTNQLHISYMVDNQQKSAMGFELKLTIWHKVCFCIASNLVN